MILLFTGANGFAMRRALDILTARFLDKNGAHAIERIDGESFDTARLPDVLQGASLFAPQRLVLMRDAGKNKPLWDALGEWAERATDGVTLVLLESAPDKRTRTYKQLQKFGRTQDFPELNEGDLARWIVSEANAAQANIDNRTAVYLVQQVGVDQWRLHGELQKLIGAGPQITRQTIDDLVEPSPQVTAFELLDAVLAGNSAKADQLIARLKASEDPYKLFGLLVSQVQTLALVVSAQGRPADAIAKQAGVHPFVVRKMQPHTRRIGQSRLREVIEAVATTDVQMKSTGIDPWILLQQCLSKIANY